LAANEGEEDLPPGMRWARLPAVRDLTTYSIAGALYLSSFLNVAQREVWTLFKLVASLAQEAPNAVLAHQFQRR